MRGLTVHPRLRPLSSPFAAGYLLFQHTSLTLSSLTTCAEELWVEIAVLT